MTNDEIETQSEEQNFLATVADVVGDFTTGVPAPIRRNAFKAFGRLFTAAVEIPAAYLEGKAKEKEAETEGRVKIISTAARQIAENMKVDPEYARLAVQKYGERIVRERINLDDVVKVAAHEIKQEVTSLSDESQKTETSDISDDWLNHFEREASQKSSQEMKLLFGRILAGEIQKPSSFSIKTVKLLGDLDSRVAASFRNLCSLSISLRAGDRVIDARVHSLGGQAATNALKDYGLSFGQLNVLQEFGLIIPDYNSWLSYHLCVADQTTKTVALPFSYQERLWGLLPTSGADIHEEFRVHGVALSQSGKELMQVVGIEPRNKYTTALKEHFLKLNVSMVPINPKAS